MSRSSAATGGQDSTNVLMCQVLDAAGEVAGRHQDATRAVVFWNAGKGSWAERVVPFPGVLSRVHAWWMKCSAASSLDVGVCVLQGRCSHFDG
jgi:hypothetical protein